jgi:uncharacterized membrane protein YhiD involved in acid resistance
MGSAYSLANILMRERVPFSAQPDLSRQNKPDGFACVSCAWAKPAKPHIFDYCENGAKATAWEITTRRATPELFAKHSVAELLMRLPLGILSGVGFLGAGAIIRRSDRVLGITTAATLWIVTVIGLCFGGGQIGLGLLATALALVVLWGFKLVEQRMHQERQGSLILVSRDGLAHENVEALFRQNAIRIANEAIKYSCRGENTETRYELQWRAKRDDTTPPSFLAQLVRQPGVLSVEWAPRGTTGF